MCSSERERIKALEREKQGAAPGQRDPEAPIPVAPDVRVDDVLGLLRRGDLSAGMWESWLLAMANTIERAGSLGSVEQRIGWHIEVVCTVITGSDMRGALWRRLGIDSPRESLATCAKNIGWSREWNRVLEGRLISRIQRDHVLCGDVKAVIRNENAVLCVG